MQQYEISGAAPDELREAIRQQIQDAYGLDRMTPAELAAWDRYGRACDARDGLEAAHRNAADRSARRFTRRLNGALRRTGLRFSLEGAPGDD